MNGIEEIKAYMADYEAELLGADLLKMLEKRKVIENNAWSDIRWLLSEVACLQTDCDYANAANTALHSALDELQAENERLTKEREWIPVTERLPEDYKKVLTCNQKGQMHVWSHYHEYKNPFDVAENDGAYYTPTHWMPLPEPPKGETT